MSGAWSGGYAEWTEGDKAYLSVAFSWMLPKAYQRAVWLQQTGYTVTAGGPAVAIRPKYLAEVATVENNYPDAVTRHNPLATFASRGCPVGCWFCIVPKIEGKEFTLLPDFTPRPILCDNNLSALPVEYQEYIIAKYQKNGVRLEDAQSGFEPRTFDEDTYHRWKTINRGPWRLAFDEMGEEAEVVQMMRILRDEPSWKKRVYVLIGNEPIEQCLHRIHRVIEMGGEPHCQPMIALNSLEKLPMIRHDWTGTKLSDMARWANKWIWRTVPIGEYKPRINQPPTFMGI